MIGTYIDKMKAIEENILNFLTQEDEVEENYNNLITQLTYINTKSNQYDLKSFIYLINKVSKDHHRYLNFFNKIEQILMWIKDEMKKYYSNNELFKVFKTNKRILLFLFDEKIIKFDHSIYKKMMTKKYKRFNYPEFFSPEIKPFLKEELNQNGSCHFYFKKERFYDKLKNVMKDGFKQFDTKRKKGENHHFICTLIQKDCIDDFITHVEQNKYQLKSYVNKSIFETNDFLLKEEQTTLIEYAAFFGSIQIFKYLYNNGCKMSPRIWIYAIHGCNDEIIRFLEEIQVIDANSSSLKNDSTEKEDNVKKKESKKESDDNEEEEEEENCNFDDDEEKDYSDEYYEEEEEEGEEKNDSYDNKTIHDECIEESIKCHHNYLAQYIIENFKEKAKSMDNFVSCIFHNYNFFYFPKEFGSKEFMYACKYDYYGIVQSLLSVKEIDISVDKNPLKYAASKHNVDILKLLILDKRFKDGTSYFKKCKTLKCIAIPTSLTKIDRNSFYRCLSLTKVVIPSSITMIECAAVYGCSSLTQVTIPSSVTLIEYVAFCKCTSLTQINIPSSVTFIEKSTFKKCTSLKNISIPTSVMSIGDRSFKKCTSLKSIIIPSSVILIGESAFSKCVSLVNISIPDSIICIGSNAFKGCELLSQITIPSSVTSIGEGAFSFCFSLKQITIPTSINLIEKSAFYLCRSLTQITIPSSVTLIGDSAL